MAEDKDYTARIDMVKQLVEIVREDLAYHRTEINRMFEKQDEAIASLVSEVRVLNGKAGSALARVKAHELVAGAIVTLVGIGLAIWGLLK
jgi:hypothetical protein